MSGYDYGNVRLRAMKSRLLSRREMEALAEAGSLQGLISALTKTAYRKAVEAALARASGMECIAEAIRRDLMDTLGKVRTFYNGREGELVAIMLRVYDVHNIKTILRGLFRQARSDEIAAALLPVGELTPDLLTSLARAPEPRVAIDLLASAGLSITQPLLHLRAESPGAELFEMELALDQWHFQEAYQYLQRSPRATAMLRAALDMEADLSNLLTVLRFAHAPAERQALHERLGTGDLRCLFLGPGRLPFDLLAQAGEQDTVEATTTTLTETPYGQPLRDGLDIYGKEVPGGIYYASLSIIYTDGKKETKFFRFLKE